MKKRNSEKNLKKNFVWKRSLSLVLVLSMLLSCVTVVGAETPVAGTVSRTTDPATTNQVTTGDGTWTLLSNGAGPTASSGTTNYYLTSDVTLTSSLTVKNSGTVVNLYLNGYALEGNGTDSVIRVNSSGAVLNIYDSTNAEYTCYAPYNAAEYTLTGGVITGGVASNGYGGGGIMIYAGTVNMYGGNIVGNTTKNDSNLTYGGGVHIDTNGTFNLYGGSVSGNTSYHHGGGVYVQSGAVFNLYGADTYDGIETDGGAVSYNYKATGSVTGGYGAGVYVVGEVNMYGGSIDHNHANLGGGGLSVVGPFTMTGGTINDNTSSGAGAGIFIGDNATVAMSGEAAVEDNIAGGKAGGIYLSKATSKLTMTGNAIVTGNQAGSLGGGVTYEYGTFDVSGNATVTGNTLTNGTVANTYIAAGNTINVVGALSSSTIGTTYVNGTGVVAVGTSSYDVTISDKNKFTSDEGYDVITRDNDVQLVEALSGIGTDKSSVYSATAINVSTLGMFDFAFTDTGFGDFTSSDFATATKTYKIVAGTGQGAIENNETASPTLTVSTVGTFTVTVTTTLCDYAPPSVQTATLTVTPKEITVSNLIGVERRYEEGNTYVAVTGGTITGIINEDDVSINYEETYGVIDDATGYKTFGDGSNTSQNFDISIHNITLTGSDAGNYTVKYDADVDVPDVDDDAVTINKDLPYISWPDAQDIIVGTASANSQLLGGKVLVEYDETWYTISGAFQFVDTGDALNNTSVGTYAREVKFVIDDYSQQVDETLTSAIWSAIETSLFDVNNIYPAGHAIDDRTHYVYQIVEPAEVEFTVDGSGGVTAKIVGTETTVDASNYTVTEATWSSDENVTLVNVAFNNSNYRHAGTMESTGKQIGAYYNNTTGAEYYDVTFSDGTNDIGSLKITDADPQDIHILPGYTDATYGEVVAWTTQWAGDYTTYEVGTRYPQPSRDVTFTAVYAEENTGSITGTVYGTDLDGEKYDEEDNQGLSDIGVTLMQGSEIIATTTTDSNGDYEFETVPYGKYNIVFTRDFGTKTEVTIFVEVDASTETISPTLADASTHNSILHIAEGMTAITVKDFNDAITNASSRLSITSVDTDTANAMIAGANTTSDNLKLFYHIDLTTPNSDGDYESTDTDNSHQITYYIPLAGIYQGKDNYNVYYMSASGGTVTTLKSGTDYVISEDTDLLTLTVTKSGIYGLSFGTAATAVINAGSDSVTYTKSAIPTADLFVTDNNNASIDLGSNPVYTIADKDGVATTDATIDASSGEVSVTKIGTYTITVTTVATETDPSKIYTTTLTVTAKEITISGISAYPQASVYNDYEGTVTLEEGGTLETVETGDRVSIDWTGVVATINDTGKNQDDSDASGYWLDYTLTEDSRNTFDVDITGLAITGDDAGNYTLANETSTTQVLIYQDAVYFSWPTAKEVVYGTGRDNDDLYGGKVMVEKIEIQEGVATVSDDWVLLEGHFEWVENVNGDKTWDGSSFTTDNAGTQSYYVKFVEDYPSESNKNASNKYDYAGNEYDTLDEAQAAYNDATYRNSIDTTTQLITQVVQKAQVEFTVDASTGVITAQDIDNDSDLDGAYFTPMWWLQEDGASLLVGAENCPTSETTGDGFYLAYASMDENYRHAGLSVSTGKQIGSFYLNTETTTYTVTFTVEEGDTAPTAITGAAEGDIHILPTLTTMVVVEDGEDYAKYSGWYDAATETTYAFGERFSQKDTDVTLTAILTPEKNATISGTIQGTDLDGREDAPLEYIAVTLMQGSQLIDYTETDSDGKYSFAVAAGSYNLDVTRDQYDVQNEMTVYVSVASGENVTKNFDIPDTTQNAELLVTTGDLDVVVEGLTALTEVVASGNNTTTVRLEISDEENINTDRDEEPEYLKLIRAAAEANGHNDDNNNFKLFVDLDLTKIVDGVSEALTELPIDGGIQQTLTFYIPLSGIHQNYDNYYVYRYHDGDVDILYEKGTSKADSTEYVELIGTDMLAVTAYKFSLYGVAYDDDTPTTTKPSTTTTTTTTDIGAELNREDHNVYMYGYPDLSFNPSGNITRAETTVMFSRLMVATMEDGVSYENSFTDVGDSLWYYENIGFMEGFGIVTGYIDGSFNGDGYITRAEFATIACRFDDLSSDAACPFTDVGDHWAASYITAAAEKGWITGYEDDTFRPDQYITRAEAVTLVNRMLERYCDEDYIANNPDLIAWFTDLDEEHWAYYQIMEATHSHDYTKTDDGEIWSEITTHALS